MRDWNPSVAGLPAAVLNRKPGSRACCIANFGYLQRSGINLIKVTLEVLAISKYTLIRNTSRK